MPSLNSRKREGAEQVPPHVNPQDDLSNCRVAHCEGDKDPPASREDAPPKPAWCRGPLSTADLITT